MAVAQQQLEAKKGMLKCTCSSCKTNRSVKKMDIRSHLYLKKFIHGCNILYLHGERSEYGSTSESHTAYWVDEHRTDVDYGVGTILMVNDAYRKNLPSDCRRWR